MGAYKKVPSFWQSTDFENKITYVQSDHPEFLIIRVFDWSDQKFCDQAMDDASAYIKKLEAGRISFRKVPPQAQEE